MNKYFVLRMYALLPPSVVRVCDKLDNAKELARIYAEEDNCEYIVAAAIVEGASDGQVA